jgi:hypothetical protein
MFKRLQSVAQIVGFVVIGLLAFSGVVSLFDGTNPVAAALGLRAPQAPQAIEPAIVNYQGMLYDDLGAPLSGEYDLTFRLYDDPVVPVTQSLWTETIPGVTVRDGRFSVLLGDTTPIDYADFAQANTYVGIQVGTYDELVPRQRFASVPYAFYATRASGLTAADGSPADAVTVDDNGNVSFAGNVSGALNVTGPISANNINASGNITAAGTVSGGNISTNGNITASGAISASGLDVGNGYLYGGRLVGSSLEINDNDPGDGYFTLDGNDLNTTEVLNIQSHTNQAVKFHGDIEWTGHLLSLDMSSEYDVDSAQDGWVYHIMTPTSNSICFLTRVEFEDIDSENEDSICDIGQSGSNWRLGAYSETGDDNSTHCSARCLSW